MLIVVLAAVVLGIISVSRAMGDTGGAAQTAATAAIVVVAFVLVVFVLSVEAVGRPVLRTALVMVSVALVCLIPVGVAAASELYRAVAIRPICERLETADTRYDGISRNADGFTSIERYFTVRLECHYRTADPAVPEGIPTRVDLADERLAGGWAWPLRLGNAFASVGGFAVALLLPFPIWRWWFRSMMREARRDRAEGIPGVAGGGAATEVVGP